MFDMMASHQRVLIAAALRTAGPILELGCGWYSTPLLREIDAALQRPVFTIDTNREWASRFPGSVLVESWDDCWRMGEPLRWGLAFVDCSPRESRVRLVLRLLPFVSVFVLHDTEPPAPAVKEHGYKDADAYGFDEVLGTYRYDGGGKGLFPFQYTDKTHDVWTTVCSCMIDVERWF